jgi:hypothetical protein
VYIGTAIALIAIGAILAFAVEFEIAGLNISLVGIILMIVGAIGIVLELAVFAPRRTTAGSRREVVRERDTY